MKHSLKSLLLIPLLLASSMAFAETFNFSRVTSNNAENLGSQLSVNVTDNGSGSVLFTFNNSVGIASNVAEIYFDNEATNFFTSYSISSQTTGLGTSFADSMLAPPNPPGVTGFSADYGIDNGNTGLAGGLNTVAEFVTVAGLLSGSTNFAAVIDAINNGTFNIAMHVRSIGQLGGSDSYTIVGGGTPNAVPLPAAAWLFMSGLGLFGLGKKRSKL